MDKKKGTLKPIKAVLWGLLLCGVVHGDELKPSPLETLSLGELDRRSIVSEGNAYGFCRFVEKARRGEALTIGVIGGSITQGARASMPEKRYANLVVAGLRELFPSAKINLVNAGIGGTGSNYGCLRAKHDLLLHQPDLVIIEFSVNDSFLQEKSLPTYEGLVRQAIRSQAAVLLLFTMTSIAPETANMDENLMPGTTPVILDGLVRGTNVQYWHAQVGRHYGLPMVSYRDAAWPEIASGRLAWADLMADKAHPNDYGHELAARGVMSCLERMIKAVDALRDRPAVPSDGMPPPLFSDRFERVEYTRARTLEPMSNQGWARSIYQGKSSWIAEQPGSEIVFEVKGTGVAAVFQSEINQGGIAEVSVDALPATRIYCRNDRFPLPVVADLAEQMESKTHRVKIKVLPAKDGSNAVRLLGLAGMRNL